jgi:hypothetical protein
MRVELKYQQKTTGAILYNVFETGFSRPVGRLYFFPGRDTDLAGTARYDAYEVGNCREEILIGSFEGCTAQADALRAIRVRLNERFAPVNPGLPSDADGLPS